MPDVTREYIGQRFRPRANDDQDLLLFVTPAGIPTDNGTFVLHRPLRLNK
jgi:hypothetical protein